MTPGPLSQHLLQVCDEVEHWIGDAGLETIDRARDSLREPLRVAVVGRVKAGKSTLVNALIGRRIAPTAATECTRAVTWYRHGRPDGADLVLHNGERCPLPFADGLPDTLDAPLEDVSRIEVRLPEHALKSLTLIDTPGLASLTTELDAAARAAVLGDEASRRAAGDVDAIIFVFRETQRQDEVDFMQDFASATADRGTSAMNAVGLLSRADEYGEGAYGDQDPVQRADGSARRLALEQTALLADVVPMAGLLAESARTGRITEEHAAALARLAALDDSRLRMWEQFSDDVREAGVTASTMHTLLTLLGPYGVRTARHHAASGAPSVYAWCEQRSGIQRLEAIIADRFVRRADVLKAGSVLASLDRLEFDRRIDRDARHRFKDRLEEARLDPVLHPIRELQAAEALRRRPGRNSDVLDRLERLISAGAPAEVLELGEDAPAGDCRRAALDHAGWATGLAATAAPDLVLAEAGRVLARSYLLLAERLS